MRQRLGVAGLQSTQAGETRVAYPTIKRRLVRIFALCTFETYTNTTNYCNEEGFRTQNLWRSQLALACRLALVARAFSHHTGLKAARDVAVGRFPRDAMQRGVMIRVFLARCNAKKR